MPVVVASQQGGGNVTTPSAGPGVLAYTGATAAYLFPPISPMPAPAPGPGSLLRSAPLVERITDNADPSDPDSEWGKGLSVLPEGSSIGIVQAELNQAAYVPNPSRQPIQVVPVVLAFAVPISTLQRNYYGTEGWQDRLSREFDAMSGTLLETELYAGAVAQANGFPNRYLTDATTVLVSKAALAPAEALARLEQALTPALTADPNDPMAYVPAGYGQPGSIHMTMEAASLASVQFAVPGQGDGRLVTKLGNSVIAGRGYLGTGPATFANGGADNLPGNQGTVLSDTSWAYATDQMRVRLGPVNFIGDMTDLPLGLSGLYDRDRNTAYRYAWRLAAAWWEGRRHYACLVDHFGLHKQTTGTQPD